MYNLVALVTFLAVLSHRVEACSLFKLKDSVREEIDFFIQTTKEIYLVEAIGKQQNGNVSLKVTETIKGPKRKIISLKAQLVEPGLDVDNTFNNHTDEKFWNSRYIGRVDDKGICDFTPDFVKGKKYLVILDDRYWFKKAELINSTTDNWYLKVKNLSKKN